MKQPQNTAYQVASVDLGSNSFHMLVAELRANEPVVIDRLREIVMLRAGLTPTGDLTRESQQRALDCLERFGQRLRHIPLGNVRAVGTNTLRLAKNSGPFLELAKQALGHPIEIISGIEEARLIYQGVAQNFPPDGKRRLVMDIGGGSTEFIIGIDQTPIQKESLAMGCVSTGMAYFADGKVTAKRFKKAVIFAQQQLEPFEHLFMRTEWNEALGASGSIRAIRKILETRGWSKDGISSQGLNQLVEYLLSSGKIDKDSFPDLNPSRYPTFPGGLAILSGAFNALGIQHMQVSDRALREGLLYDLIGRINQDDIREHTVASLANRFHVDMEKVKRIQETIKKFLKQNPLPQEIDKEAAARWINWSAALHTIGLDIAHSGYHKHGAYILENADLPGFSKQDQFLLAALVRAHRRKLHQKSFRELTAPWNTAAKPMALILRLAIVLNRSRQLTKLPDIKLYMKDNRMEVKFPPNWLEDHPLTLADLEQEAEHLTAEGITLNWS